MVMMNRPYKVVITVSCHCTDSFCI